MEEGGKKENKTQRTDGALGNASFCIGHGCWIHEIIAAVLSYKDLHEMRSFNIPGWMGMDTGGPPLLAGKLLEVIGRWGYGAITILLLISCL